MRVEATNLNPKGDRLYIYELPLKQSLGRYQHEEPRFRVFDTATNQVVKTFPAPEQTMSFAFSPDGKRIYAFCIGQDILVLDSEDGHLLGTIPLAHRNITGIRATYGLPILANYQEQNYVLSFAIIVEDSITDTDTLALGVIDLKQKNPTLADCRDSSRSSRTGTRSKESAPRPICTRHTSCGTTCGRSTDSRITWWAARPGTGELRPVPCRLRNLSPPTRARRRGRAPR